MRGMHWFNSISNIGLEREREGEIKGKSLTDASGSAGIRDGDGALRMKKFEKNRINE